MKTIKQSERWRENMKLASYARHGDPGWGIVMETGIAPMMTRWATLGEGLAAGVAALSSALAEELVRVPLHEIEWTAPVTPSTKILCVGINYGRHIAEMKREVPVHPSVFVRFADSFVGHEQPIVCPASSKHFDFEAELAIVIGRTCRHATLDNARTFVGGYTCLGDNSVRDFQKHAAQVTAGKNWEKSGSIGPWVVTADEIADPQQLTVSSRLNGTEMQNGSTADMLFPVVKMITYLSTFTTLHPGDIIATGTPDGVGAGRTPPVWMQAGDRLEIEVSSIGVLANPVINESDLPKAV
jgi:2-keto-4-pentenoate hydratase/2-oxohepta-3-ene-1,7-dioic acid hydratase in catechol pathway